MRAHQECNRRRRLRVRERRDPKANASPSERVAVPDATRSVHRRLPPDLLAILGLLLVTAIAEWDLLVGGTMIGQDAAVYFYPVYEALGERLRSGDIPGWNPAQFGGAPFAGNPQSGWMYVPAMLLFSLLPLDIGAKAYMFLHLFGAGVAMYALARVLRLGVPGAATAAIAYELTGFLFERNVCCFAYGGVAGWLPLGLLSSELAIRSRDRLHQALWWALGGFALSQILAAWLGQGSYYALLVLGGFVLYRTVLHPPAHVSGVRARAGALIFHGGGVLLFGFGLAAAGVLPRAEYNTLSSLAGGYPGTQAAVHSGWSIRQWGLLLVRQNWYAGGVTLLLAAIGPVVARGRHATSYFAAVCVGALVLSGQGPTPLHSVLYHLPGFARLHPHDPERVMVVFYLGAALLAGAAINCLGAWGRRGAIVVPVIGALVLILELGDALQPNVSTPRATILAMWVAVLLMAVWTLVPRWGRWAAVLLVALLLVDNLGAGREAVLRGVGGFKKVDLNEYYEPGGTVQYLRSHSAAPPSRYFGYDPAINVGGMLYRWHWALREPAVLAVNNRATLFGLQDLQGYDPVHVARYDEYLSALNGRTQEYRGSYVLNTGLTSPLLDILNVQYAVVPLIVPSNRTDLQLLDDAWREVYVDQATNTRVLENPTALPRAWLVHDARRIGRGEALTLLASGAVNPRRTALLERAPPPLGRPADARMENVLVAAYEPDHITLSVRAAAPALLITSEIYYPAWTATIDGKRSEVYAANHALRAVAVPAGEHVVEFRYESWTLRLGTAITVGTLAIVAALLALLAARSRRRRHVPEASATD